MQGEYGNGVTLVTVAYNSSAALKEFWSTSERGASQWVVVDNCSVDDSREVAESLGARVISMDENRGFSAANNRVRDIDSGDVVIFCNPDLRVTAEGIERLASLARATGALVAPQLVNADGTPQENGRGAPYPHRKILHMAGSHSRAAQKYSRIAGPTDVLQVVWVMGAAVAATRETLDHIGWWNDSYFIYYEDHEIGLRALKYGVPTLLDGGTRWEHGWARETKGGFSRSAWRFEIRSGTRFYLTHWRCLLPLGRWGREVRRVDRLRGRELATPVR